MHSSQRHVLRILNENGLTLLWTGFITTVSTHIQEAFVDNVLTTTTKEDMYSILF